MKSFFKYTTLIILGAIVLACANQNQLSTQDALARNTELSKLENALVVAKGDGLNLMAPSGYNAVKSQYEEALNLAKNSRVKEAEQRAQQGLLKLEDVRGTGERSAAVLRDALNSRRAAILVGAASMMSQTFNEADEALKAAAALLERSEVEQAKKKQPELIERYRLLEEKTLEKDISQIASQAIERAKNNDADDYAPETFAAAENELVIALDILDNNRQDVAKANSHAVRARQYAQKSHYIAELAKQFDRRQYSTEDIILWYHQQLETLSAPLESGLAFYQPNRDVIQSIRSDIAALASDKQQLLAALSGTQKIQEQLVDVELSRQETQKRYETVQSLFTADEANVFRKGADVLLEIHGFSFSVGGSEITAQNYALLDRIIRAVEVFEKPKVMVSGHTDATGETEFNVALSENRAANVANFLTRIAADKLTSINAKGYGELRPVATNETAQGRARNRRVEILIQPQLQ